VASCPVWSPARLAQRSPVGPASLLKRSLALRFPEPTVHTSKRPDRSSSVRPGSPNGAPSLPQIGIELGPHALPMRVLTSNRRGLHLPKEDRVSTG